MTSIDPATGEQPINPLLGLLPPNLTAPEGDGFVSYSVRPKATITTGTVIDAEATIVFDINEPIDTPAILNTIDVDKPTSTINPLAATINEPNFTVTWAGNDNAGGSALASFTVYVSDNGSAFVPWLEKSTLTEAIFKGETNHTYAFYSVAADNAGNVQVLPTVAQASIKVVPKNTAPVLANPIKDLSTSEETLLNFTLPANTFSDSDAGDSLIYSANLENGNPLPNWLSFNTVNGTFSGTPGNNDSGILNIQVTASDKSGATVSDIFTLTVINAVNGNSANNNLSGSANADLLNGFAGDDYLEGLAGDDTLDGGTGRLDRLFGGAGNDTIIDPDGIEGAHGGTGNDTISVTFASSWINSSNTPRSDGKITGGYGDDNITVTMNHSQFYLNLKGDEPTNNALDGNDEITLFGTYQNSVVDLGGGNDIFYGGNGKDSVSGKAGNDLLLGRGGNDALTGDGGNDTLLGGASSDTLTGGAGIDQFVYTNLSDAGDVIKDFKVGEDKIVLSDLLSSVGYTANNPMADGYVRWVAGSGGASVQVDPDGQLGSSVFKPFATLENLSANALSANDLSFKNCLTCQSLFSATNYV
ncbi:MAG: type I secretion C-terminal target domain-containing protein [Hydrococcus sp. RM1_1_31]|nr:type I secretion C-terminal target domain-containing protein [Hydrococcus sp. RM1_1_31]